MHPSRMAAYTARVTAVVDVEGDVIEAEAHEAGDRAFAATRPERT